MIRDGEDWDCKLDVVCIDENEEEISRAPLYYPYPHSIDFIMGTVEGMLRGNHVKRVILRKVES